MNAAKDRREKLLSQAPPVLNGIDYVTIVNPQKTVIEVHFLTTAPLNDSNVTGATVIGGPTATPVSITSEKWAVDAGNRPILTLNLAAPGDSSTYIFSLTSDVLLLDRFFDHVAFSFIAGEPSTVDCEAPAAVAQVQSADVPPIDYLAKDFMSFRDALSDFSNVRYPAWQERSEADFGVMFMEALCALGDDLSYQQDRISAEAYLATATERLSIVRHARLVDYEPKPALAASVFLQFAVEDSVTSIPPGLAVSAAGPDGTLIYFETGLGLADTNQYPANSEWNCMKPYWWDSSVQTLNVGATEMWLQGHGLGLSPGVLLLLDTVAPVVGAGDIRETVRILSVSEEIDNLFGVQITHLAFQTALTQQHDLSATLVKGNLIPATQGLRYTESFAIGSWTADVPPAIVRTGPNQSMQYLYTLGNAPLTWLSSNSDASITQTPEIVLTEEPSQGASSASSWTWYQSILDAPAFASAFTIDPIRYTQLPPELASESIQVDYDGSKGDTIRFGFVGFGSSPAQGSIFTVVYRAGAGSIGNMAADSITTINPASPLAEFATAVTNPFPAQGGADAEPNATIVRLAPYAYQAGQFNAVLPADYGAVATRNLDWIERAGCSVRYTGSWLTAFTSAEPATADVPTETQIRDLIRLLDRYRMAGHESYVLAPDYMSLDLRISVSAKADAFNSDVAAAVLQALGTQTLPNGNAAFFAHSNFTFGQPLERSALEAAIQCVQGVAGVTSIRYRRAGSTTPYVEMTDQVAVSMDQTIRVDNSASLPNAGSVSITVTGGK